VKKRIKVLLDTFAFKKKYPLGAALNPPPFDAGFQFH